MEYVAFRVIKGFKNYLVQAQKESDLNWTTLSEMESKELAEETACKYGKVYAMTYKKYITVYNGGYGIAKFNYETPLTSL